MNEYNFFSATTHISYIIWEEKSVIIYQSATRVDLYQFEKTSKRSVYTNEPHRCVFRPETDRNLLSEKESNYGDFYTFSEFLIEIRKKLEISKYKFINFMFCETFFRDDRFLMCPETARNCFSFFKLLRFA